jgi:hypothetical protein
MIKTTSEYNALKLMEHSLLNTCPNIAVQGFDKLKSLLSSSYSRVISKEQLESDLVSFSKNPILNDILYAVAISANNRPLTIELVEGKMNDYHLESEADGFVQVHYNRIVISKNEQFTLNKNTFMHEFSHKAMMVIFKNDHNPYKNYEQKKKFQSATKEVLINANDYIKNQYKILLKFNETDHPYHIGEQLNLIISTMLSDIIDKNNNNNNNNILNLFENNPELYISSNNIPATKGSNCIALAIIYDNFELVVKLLKNGAYITDDCFLSLYKIINENNTKALQ